MDSAIPIALRCPRLHERRVDDDYVPPFPAWTGEAEATTPTAMAYLGVQARPEHASDARAALRGITEQLVGRDGATHRDLALFRDEAGYDNYLAIAYWNTVAEYEAWRDRVAAWWASGDRESGSLGFFREIYTPTRDRYETLFSSERLEGVGLAMGELRGPIVEHGYWGSMRDRLPLSQTDRLKPGGDLVLKPISPARIGVIGHENVALIRSGQDWAATTGEERTLYLEKMEPILHEGMTFLSREGNAIGCYSNRYMLLIDDEGQPLERSFGLSQWRSLAEMERWSESHPTHVRIFGTFMEIVQELEGALDLRLYHEVSVLQSTQQNYEYVNCHPQTGMLSFFSRDRATTDGM